MAEQQHLSEHPAASSSVDYRYPPPSFYEPPPASPFHQAYQPTNVIPGSFPAPVQQPTNAQHHGNRYHQDGQLSSTKRNSDALDQIPTNSYKKQALSTNPFANFATSSSIPQDHLQELPGPSKAYPPASQITPIEHPNLVIGSAIATDASSTRRNDSHRVDIFSKTSSSNPSSSMQISGKELHSSAPKASQHDAIRSRTNVSQKQHTRRTSTPRGTETMVTTVNSFLRSLGHLPHRLRYKQFGKEQTDICVVAKKVIDQGHVFHPVRGDVKMLDCLHNTQAWELCFYGSVAAYVVPELKKWMSYVRNARFREECNLEAGQVYGRIHFTVIRRIEPGSELRVFYSDVYRENCGFMYDLSALNYNKGTDDFSCTLCNIKVNNSKSMIRHYKFTHPNGSSKVPPVQVQKRMDPQDGHHTLELEYSNESGESLGNDDENEEEGLESDVGSRDGPAWLEEDRGDQGLRDRGVFEKLICLTCGKNFNSQSQLLMHESFHEAEEGKDDGLDEEGEENSDEELDDDVDDTVDEQYDEGDDTVDKQDDENMEEKVEDPRCSICGFAFDEDKLAGHIAKHKTHSFPCDECGKLYRRQGGTYRHKREVHGAATSRQRRNVNIFLKGFTASNTPQLRSAVSAAPGDLENWVPLEPNRCKVCNFLASSSYDLDVHLDQHKNRPFGCEHCGVVFLDRNYMIKHLRRKHGALKEAKFLAPCRTESIMEYLSGRALCGNLCKDCGYSCVSIDEFNEHEFKHRDAPFGCKECGRVFRYKKDLSTHICTANEQGVVDDAMEKSGRGVTPMHQKSKGHTCLSCGFKTMDGALLVVHVNSHSHSPFGCKTCGNTYKCKRSLGVHMLSKHRTVSDDESSPKRPSSSSIIAASNNLEVNRDPCPHCGYYTPHKSVLVEHLEKHIKNPHGCMDCGNTYSGLNILYRHKREKHNGGYLNAPRHKKSGQNPDLPDNLKIIGDTCARCGFQSSDQRFLADHAMLHLTHPFGCIDCGNVYTTGRTLRRHKQEKHATVSENKEKVVKDPNTCRTCGFTCHNKNIREDHRRKHRIAKYGCDVCGEVFPEDKFVIMHKREKHGDLLEGLQNEALEFGDEQDGDYLESGFIEINVKGELNRVVRDAGDPSEMGGE